MRKKRFLGLTIVLVSILILSFNLTPTAAVIGASFPSFLNIIALIILVIGLVLFLADSLERNLALEVLRSGAVITDPRKIEKIARKMGYSQGKEVREGYQVLDEQGKPLTVIPRHHISGGVYRNIMKSLSAGESTFRKYSHA